MTPIKKQIVGPREARAIEVYESKGVPHQGFAVDVKVYTPEVGLLTYPTAQRAQSTPLCCSSACLSLPRP